MADGVVMFMHCGPVRHKIPSETDLVQELHVHPTATTIREDIDSDTPGILQSIIIPALVSDRTRTAQIVDDVVRAIRRGRNCLVMAGRTEHVDLLAAEITSRGLASTSPTGAGYAPRSGSSTTPPIRHDRQRLGRKSHC